MSKKLKILVIIIICLMIIIGIFIKVKGYYGKKDNDQKSGEAEILHDSLIILDENGYVLKGSRKNSSDISNEKRLEENRFVKGFVLSIYEEGFFEIYNSYMIDSLGRNIVEYDHFASMIPFSPNDVSIVNYYTSEEIEIKEIHRGDLILFNANIVYSTIEEPIVTITDNKIFILHQEDLEKLILDKYKGEKVLSNIKIVGTNDYNFEGKDYKYVYAQMKFNTPQNDELVYCFTLQLTDNTIIENGQDSQYADIVLEDNFEKTTESVHYNDCRKVNKITYK